MRPSILPAALVGVVLCLSLCASWFSVRYYFALKELHTLQGQYLRMNNTMKAVQSLANRSMQYGKQNPAIRSILEQYEVKPSTNAVPDLPAPSGVPGPP